MSYTPKTWANGDTITAADLNHIEQGMEIKQRFLINLEHITN